MAGIAIPPRAGAGFLLLLLAAPGLSAQVDDKTSQRDVLLKEAAAAALQISDLRNRTFAMTSIASAYQRFGDKAAARSAFQEAFRLWESLPGPPGQKQGMVMLFTADYESSLRVADLLPNPESRDRLYDQLLRRPGYFWGSPDVREVLGRIRATAVREQAMLRMLQASQCKGSAVTEIPNQVRLPHIKAAALAAVAECEGARGGASGASVSAAIALAMDSSATMPAVGPPTSFSCAGPLNESPRDEALGAVGRTQARAGDFAGALVTANAIGSEAARADLMISTAVALAKKERFAEALTIVRQVPSGFCHETALGDVAPVLWKLGAHDTARELIGKMESGSHRAYAMKEIAHVEFRAKRTPEGLAWLAQAADVALQTVDPMRGFYAALDVAGLQSLFDAAAAMGTLRRLLGRVKDVRTREPNRWPGMATSLADGMARAGNAPEGRALVQDFIPAIRAPAYRRIAASQVRRGELPEAMIWIGALEDPFEKCFALLGAADGLSSAQPELASD